MRRLTRQGQSALEAAAAVVGILALLVGSLYIWSWADRMLVHRQEGYQFTRTDAGTFRPLDSAMTMFGFGMPNPYPGEPLEIFNERPRVIPPPGGGVPPPICEDGMALMEEAEALFAQAEELMKQADEIKATAEPYSTEALRVGDLYNAFCEPDPSDDVSCGMLSPQVVNGVNLGVNFQQICVYAIAYSAWPAPIICGVMGDNLSFLSGKIDAIFAQAEPLEEQATALFQQAEALVQQAYEACGGGGF